MVKSENGAYEGYEISVYTSDKELVARYMDGSHRIAVDESEPETLYVVGKSMQVQEDGCVYYFLNETSGRFGRNLVLYRSFLGV